jgi:hypothetical protein
VSPTAALTETTKSAGEDRKDLLTMRQVSNLKLLNSSNERVYQVTMERIQGLTRHGVDMSKNEAMDLELYKR